MGHEKGAGGLVSTAVFAIICITLVVIFYEKPFALASLLLIWAGLFLFYWKRMSLVGIFFVCGIAGALAEIVGIANGAWSYADPQFAGIPVWLPLLWGSASVFVIRVYHHVKAYFGHGE